MTTTGTSVLNRTRRARPSALFLIGPLAAFGLVVSGLGGPSTQDSRTTAAQTPVVQADPAPCTDVVLLAARGSREGAGAPRGAQFGPTLDRYRQAMADRLRDHDRSFSARSVTIKAPGPKQLKRPGARSKARAARATGPATVKAWSRGADAAAARVVSDLVAAAAQCPNQQIVLAGYAQGAMAVHRALLELERLPDIASRIAGVALLADGDRSRRATRISGAPAAEPGPGLATRHLGKVRAVPTAGSIARVWNVCSRGDLVCDPRGTSFAKARAVHRGYTKGKAAARVTRVGEKAGDRVARWALPSASVEQIGVPLGQQVVHQLRVRVRAKDRDMVRWGDVQGLPQGVTLDESGALRGTPAEAGTYDVTFTVHNSADPAYQHRAVGRLQITVVGTGDGEEGPDRTPVSVTTLSTGGTQTCRVQTDGSAVCWGRNNWGQFGNGSTAGTRAPVPAAGFADWRQLSTSGSSTCGIRQDRTLWCWGLNQYGQLGDGTRKNRSKPVQVGTKKWAQVSTGWAHTCGIRNNGSAWCWGYNKVGQVGDGSATRRVNPKKVAGDHGTWRTITAGGFFSCGTTTSGRGLCWGANAFGQLGNGTRAGSSRPVPVGFTSEWERIEASWYTACGLKTTGELRCWGNNEQGQLGDGTRTHRIHPALAGGGRAFRDVSVGEAHVCAVGTDDALACWGDNTYGQLGDGGTARLARRPVTPQHADGWLTVEAGWLHTCGIRRDATTWCWGNNEFGQVGDGTSADRHSGVPVA